MRNSTNVYVLQPVLSQEQINRLLQMESSQLHHDLTGHGDDEGHGIRQSKSLYLPDIAQSIWKGLPRLQSEKREPYSVDVMMKLYRLESGAGAVSPHQDSDFDGPEGTKALYSVLVYLNEGYLGGETRFSGTQDVPEVSVGGGLIFKHDLTHEGLTVRSGVKYVLKTDLFLR